MAKVHIVGAGLAGLACAVSLASEERPVILYEGAGHAGGRCRSFHDEVMGCTIDNGNHLLLSGNTAVHEYLALIGAESELVGPDRALFPFVDLAARLEWTVEIGNGRWPAWIFTKNRRIPGTNLLEYLKSLKLLCATDGQAISDVVDINSNFFKRFLEPLAVGVLNTPAEFGSASLLAAVLKETFGQGGNACMPRMAKNGLSQTFVEPALKYLSERCGDFTPHRRLRGISIKNNHATALQFTSTEELIAEDDKVILTIPAHGITDLVPTIEAPEVFHPIINAHFRLDNKYLSPQGAGLLGIVGGTAHWVFFRGDALSVTVSAADDLSRASSKAIAERIWRDLQRAISGLPQEMPVRHRIIKERRATISQTPASIRRRPTCKTYCDNVYLAGDWTDTGLPATIEGAIRSGFRAARAIFDTDR